MVERAALAAQQPVEARRHGPGEQGEDHRQRRAQDQRMQYQRPRIVPPAGAQSAGHGSRHAAAHAARGHHRHHHHERKHQREARQRLGAQSAKDEGLGNGDKGLRHHHQRGRAGQLQQAGSDGGGKKGMGACGAGDVSSGQEGTP